MSSPAADKRHFGRHQGHEPYTGIERQAGHVNHGVGDVPHVHPWLRHCATVRHKHTGGRPLCHFDSRIADSLRIIFSWLQSSVRSDLVPVRAKFQQRRSSSFDRALEDLSKRVR